MKKIYIKKKNKNIILLSVFLVSLACLIGAIYIVQAKIPESNSYLKHNHTWSESISWQTFFRPESIMANMSQLDKTAVYQEYTDTINVTLDIDFESDFESSFVGTIEVVQHNIGRYGSEGLMFWNKKETLMKEDIEIENITNDSISTKTTIDIVQLNNIAESIKTDMDIGGDYKSNLSFIIEGVIDNNGDSYDFYIEPMISIPLAIKAGAITPKYSEVMMFEDLVNQTIYKSYPREIVVLLAIIGGFCLVSLLVVMIFFEGVKATSFISAKERILRNYAERIVKVFEPVTIDKGKMLEIKDINDIVKAADELSRPILFYDDKRDENLWLYVLKSSIEVYYYKLSSSLEG